MSGLPGPIRQAPARTLCCSSTPKTGHCCAQGRTGGLRSSGREAENSGAQNAGDHSALPVYPNDLEPGCALEFGQA
jgi:hypothetical protein